MSWKIGEDSDSPTRSSFLSSFFALSRSLFVSWRIQSRASSPRKGGSCAQNAVTHPEVESVVGQTEGVNQRHRDNYVRLTTHAAFSCPSWASQVSRVRLSESTSQVRLDLVLVHGTRDKVDLCLSVHVPVPARPASKGGVFQRVDPPSLFVGVINSC